MPIPSKLSSPPVEHLSPTPSNVPTPSINYCSSRPLKNSARFDNIPLSSLNVYSMTFSPTENNNNNFLLQPSFQSHEPHPLALLGNHIFSCLVIDTDTMTLKEALRQEDRSEFLQAMSKEFHDHISCHHWEVIPRRSVPSHKTCIPMV